MQEQNPFGAAQAICALEPVMAAELSSRGVRMVKERLPQTQRPVDPSARSELAKLILQVAKHMTTAQAASKITLGLELFLAIKVINGPPVHASS